MCPLDPSPGCPLQLSQPQQRVKVTNSSQKSILLMLSCPKLGPIPSLKEEKTGNEHPGRFGVSPSPGPAGDRGLTDLGSSLCHLSALSFSELQHKNASHERPFHLSCRLFSPRSAATAGGSQRRLLQLLSAEVWGKKTQSTKPQTSKKPPTNPVQSKG